MSPGGDITLDRHLSIGEDILLYAQHPSQTSIEWESSDSDVVTVDPSGRVSAVGNGEAIVKAKYTKDGEVIYATIKLLVGDGA